MDSGLRLSFLLGLLVSALFMKIASILQTSKADRRELVKFILSPLLSVQSWEKSVKTTSKLVREIFFSAIKYSLLLVLSYYLFWKINELFHLPKLVVYYLAVLPALLIGESLGPWLQLIYSISGRVVINHHCSPLLSKNIMEFWSWRWNTWISDWFREVVFRPLRGSPTKAVLVVFIFSGLWHELIINIPAKVFYDLDLIGSMLLYFLIQCIGLIIDRKILNKDQRIARQILAWIIIVGPVPLILNEAILRIVFLWPFE